MFRNDPFAERLLLYEQEFREAYARLRDHNQAVVATLTGRCKCLGNINAGQDKLQAIWDMERRVMAEVDSYDT